MEIKLFEHHIHKADLGSLTSSLKRHKKQRKKVNIIPANSVWTKYKGHKINVINI